ncbi:MAG: XkdX family protein [Candidatus Thiodiazotropha sp.]
MSIKEPLRSILEKYCHVECYDPMLIREIVRTGKGFPYDVELVKNQLREAIDKKLISPEEYEELTEEDFDTQDDLLAWLEEFLSELPFGTPSALR